ncbi:PP2C family protein-serine/threonine phosphatase [Oceanicoccus sagamiensis]|uniref:PPM-type phosphatase domain-containing protein n=1 Tax=Oceanicoccus sagamiensis TaxID=716816 RepID=A0A1X9NBG0_9GAMM|nr:protein phosphatase 2C domain-containing protein [Oceanicoccus sagamiensis]ARN75370.1 hypothetical protein BST96_15375 [Oceanicoccus sagamiensis]
MINIIGATHPGQREHNEDCFAVDMQLGLGLVADGMGGYACGEVASELVKTTVEAAAANNEGLREALARAHAVVKATAEADPDKQGMGSTAIAFKLQGLDYDIAWVGDSRAYLWDGKAMLKQITRDHSYVENLLASGTISYEEAINHPNRNLITQAVGVSGEDGLEIGVASGRLAPGQQLMICSDGLVDEVLDYDIAKLMAQAQTPDEALNSLVRAAVVAGGHDNITVVIATVQEDADGSQPAIEPEVIRTTNLNQQPEQPTQPRPAPSADITRMGGSAPLYDDTDETLNAQGLWESVVDFVVLNIPALSIAVMLIVAMVVGLFYLA